MTKFIKTIISLSILLAPTLSFAENTSVPIVVDNMSDQTIYVNSSKSNETPVIFQTQTVKPRQQHVVVGSATPADSQNYNLAVITKIGLGGESYRNTSLIILSVSWNPGVYISPAQFTINNKNYTVTTTGYNTKNLEIQILQN